MAAIGTQSGAVVLPTGVYADVQTVAINETEPNANVTKFGDSGKYTRNKAGGRLTQRLSCSGMVNASNPGLGFQSGDGASGSVTIAVGRAVSGNWLVENRSVSGSINGEYWAVSFDLVNAGEITVTT